MIETYESGISVLITFYNQEKYVDECLKSVVNQVTNFDYDIIIGDDGSTDGTLKKISYWIKKYPTQISLYIQERDSNKHYNSGIRASNNRIMLLSKVTRKYFVYLDGDDYYTDNCKLQNEYNELEKKENKNCVGCAHSVRVYNENYPSITSVIPGNLNKNSKFNLKKYWRKYYFHSDSILFRSMYIPRLKYDLICDSFNDNMITYSFMQFGEIMFLNKCMVDYRQNGNGIWAGQSRLIGVIRNLMAYDTEKKINKKYKQQSMIRHYADFKLIKQELKNNDNIVIGEFLDIALANNYTTVINISQGYIFSKNKLIDFLIYFSLKAIYILVNLDKVLNKVHKLLKKESRCKV